MRFRLNFYAWLHHIAKSVCHIVNLSLQTGDVLEQWKIARVVPILKKGDKDLISNYRPISVIPVLAKIVEKFVTKQQGPGNDFFTGGAEIV